MKSPLVHSLIASLAASLALAASPLHAMGDSKPGSETSEADFLAELPVVLSASRLAQPLTDAPGAVTVIDREMIKASGVREIAELLRLVPGFQVSFANGSNPVTAYHGLSDASSRRMQVLIDGRSVYSPFFLGGINWNMLPISLDDIERIEVLRGSNSATYGANAFLGVVSIVTRLPSQSQGNAASVTLGDQGVRDNFFRHGGSQGDFDYRFSTGRRADNGFNNLYDDRHVSFFNFRGDLRLNARDELQLWFGANENSQGAGFSDKTENPERTHFGSNYSAQILWRRVLNPDEEFSINAYHIREGGVENYNATRLIPFPPFNLIAPVDAGYRAERTHLEFQHILRPEENLRMVWGMEARQDSVASRLMFNTADVQTASLQRLFGNLEWRAAPKWLINTGALYEHYSLSGGNLAPRLTVNYQPERNHTFRFGAGTAYRNPSLAEDHANIKYYIVNAPLPPITTFQSRGGLKPERVLTREASYLGEFPALALSLDARLFHERVSRIITAVSVPPGSPLNFINLDRATVRGFEYQSRWRPSGDTLFILNQALMRIGSENPSMTVSAPTHTTTAFLSQALPGNWRAGLAHQWIGTMKWMDVSKEIPAHRNLQASLSHSFSSGPLKGEISFVTQNALGATSEYVVEYLATRRSFATLRLEF